jgi:hypothetical protein
MTICKVVLSLLTCACCLTAAAQQKLTDLVREANVEWMMGKWEAANGENVSLSWTWELNKSVAVLSGKMGDVEFKGYTAVDPVSGEIKYAGFDSQGSVTTGNWQPSGDEVVLFAESHSAERGATKMAIVFTGSASDGLTVRIHEVSGSGGMVSPARTTTKFKKQK